jgi:hypothetical protein
MTVSRRRKAAAHAAVDQAVRAALDRAGSSHRSPVRVALERLLRAVRGRSELLNPPFHRGAGAASATPEVLVGLTALANHFKSWIRGPEEWRPSALNPRPAFASLADHLFAQYPVPAFLTSAWFRGEDAHAQRYQRSFIHLGRGGSVRSAGFPASLNRTMAHRLTEAPAGYPVEHALRWAQVDTLGGSEALAEAVFRSRLGSEFGNEDFWLTALQFFVNQRKLDLGDVGLLVDYLHHQKFERERVIIGEDTEIDLDPPQPGLSLKGRTLPGLLRTAVAWREQQARPRLLRRRFTWPRSAIGAYRQDDEQGRTWTIRELLDSDELAAEGKAMHHCVADYYVETCARRETTIWSLGVETPEGRERVLTIEVDPGTKAVRQASMHCNAEPDAWCRTVLERWAAQEALTLECLAEEQEPAAAH